MRFDEERLIAHKEIASPGRELQAPELGLLQADLPTPRAVIEALLRSRGGRSYCQIASSGGVLSLRKAF